MSVLEQQIISVVASLAPDRLAPVTIDSHLVDDLGYDSPRKMELVATLENHLQTPLEEPDAPIETVREVVDWVSLHINGARSSG